PHDSYFFLSFLPQPPPPRSPPFPYTTLFRSLGGQPVRRPVELEVGRLLPRRPEGAPLRKPGGGLLEEPVQAELARQLPVGGVEVDRKSTRLNSSHSQISYAVFCLKKKKKLKI